MLNRRDFLRGMAASASLMALPSLSFATAKTSQRFVFVMLRGAADGINIVVPHGDANYERMRKALTININAENQLDGFFGLHPALKEILHLYKNKQALCMHAVASPYRSRSHFDGQNVLETGGSQPYQLKDGWLNRLLTLLPMQKANAVAFSQSVPMALRGRMQVNAYAPSRLPDASEDLKRRGARLYQSDTQLNDAWTAAMAVEAFGESDTQNNKPAALGQLAGKFLTRDDGPRIAMFESNGWDTHSGQNGRLTRQLKHLDEFVAGLKNALGEVWKNTTVLVCTEFGRTVAVNGTQGTDHGTASAAMLLGGNLNGGRVLADWPGLKTSALFEGRDLMPTMALDALIVSILSETYNLAPDKLSGVLFPNRVLMPTYEGFYRG